MKILFVDDVRDTREMFRLAFGIQGHQTELACNGVEAVNAVAGSNFDALVIDVEMPEMNGWDAVQKIRALETGASIPIIMFTAYSAADDRERALKSGADLLLRKPILPQEILSEIVAIIEKKKRDATPDTSNSNGGTST